MNRDINDKVTSAVISGSAFSSGFTKVTHEGCGAHTSTCVWLYDKLVASRNDFTGEVIIDMGGMNTKTTHARINAALKGFEIDHAIRTSFRDGGVISKRTSVDDMAFWDDMPFPRGGFGFYPEDFEGAE